MEDAIIDSEIDSAIENLQLVTQKLEKFVRIGFNSNTSFQYLDTLLKLGFVNFVLPKIESLSALLLIRNYVAERAENFKLILLIESPKALMNLPELIQVDEVTSIGLGSHDYCDIMNMEHIHANYDWANKYILNYAKAFGKEAIDVVSMNIEDESKLKAEFLNSASSGFDAKFFIHPIQLKVFYELNFISPEELELAIKVRDYVISIGGVENFGILKLQGRVIEKPHLDRFRKILNEKNHEGF